MAKSQAKHGVKNKEVETTGHEWDGIKEFNNPMPRWWVWTFYATIVWGIAYSLAYPSWPGVRAAFPGFLGWSTRADVAADIQKFTDMNADLNAKLASADLTTIKDDAALHNYASQYGRATFATFCSQCHGSGAAGAKGYPNLLDNDWLWGGDIETIQTTVTHGIRSTADDDTRLGDMPAWTDVLEEDEMANVIEFVVGLAGGEHDAAKAEEGAVVFEDNCSSCHAEGGVGDRDLGAPNLTDAIWLYGGDRATITETIANGRAGEMPSWNATLSPSQIAAVTTYVHELGGGE
ncbi:MAG TPA: cytochrome-c oxidase, cbb3-type subunit III [Rhodobacterales bacterium]|nr:cytochrome-c oxidase, cbb3-type subunit III [Rhodobacterales bacterium]